MKIRIQGNSIRYRLPRSEVSTLRKSGYIEEETAFNGAQSKYVIQILDNITSLGATFHNNTITLLFPKAKHEKWGDLERVGYENKMVLEDGQSLGLLLEKAFACLDERTEDQMDNYPNPAAIN